MMCKRACVSSQTKHVNVAAQRASSTVASASPRATLLDDGASAAQAVDLTPREFLRSHKDAVYSTVRVSSGEAYDLPLHASRLARCDHIPLAVYWYPAHS